MDNDQREFYASFHFRHSFEQADLRGQCCLFFGRLSLLTFREQDHNMTLLCQEALCYTVIL